MSAIFNFNLKIIILAFVFSCARQKYNKTKSEKITIFLNDLYGKTKSYNICTEQKIKVLKYKIEDEYGINPDSQVLNNGNKLLKDKYLVKEFLKPFDNISLNVKLNGGNDGFCFNFVNFDKRNINIKKIFSQFSSTAPKWRTIYKGINFEGYCEVCNKNVWCILKKQSGKLFKRFKGKLVNDEEDIYEKFENPMHIHTFRNRCFCPCCDNILDPSNIKNFGFFHCKYSLYGILYSSTSANNKEIISLNNISNSSRGFHYYDYKKLGLKQFLNILAVIEYI
ncbi:MAG: hypothetical protein GY830_09795 [Bacteroidetes bacterium]|nr:hypothetical protein [Bacteroidota bacterium]